ncbi:MAG: NUMOD4 domain-containing protein [Defluviitaleaceae bacterium]|nr:NUMOD4 domain-containing protein [Defluviitaleaceae bacterium]
MSATATRGEEPPFDLDGEVWREIPGYENYAVSNLGRIKNIKPYLSKPGAKNRLLKPQEDKDGYFRVELCAKSKKKKYKVHRLVALAFLENPKSLPQINHKDECKQNNNVDNLEWCTEQYNKTYKNLHYRTAKKRDYTKVIPKVIAKTKKRVNMFSMDGIFIRTYESQHEAGRQMGISNKSINSCCRGKARAAGGYIWQDADE